MALNIQIKMIKKDDGNYAVNFMGKKLFRCVSQYTKLMAIKFTKLCVICLPKALSLELRLSAMVSQALVFRKNDASSRCIKGTSRSYNKTPGCCPCLSLSKGVVSCKHCSLVGCV